jgi:hypothetical protein
VKSLYWYAIVTAPKGGTLVPGRWGDGLHGRPLHAVYEEGLAAIVSDWEGMPVGRSAEGVDASLVLQHEHVIEAIMAEVPLLPMRFGTVLAGDNPIRAVLAERYITFTGDLTRLAGCVEMGLRVLWSGPPAVPAVEPVTAGLSPGAKYLRQRLAVDQQQRIARSHGQALAETLDRTLRPLVADARTSILQTERMLLSAAYLVPRGRVAEFVAGVEALRGQHAPLAFLCTGPWPPYNFVSGA